MLPKGKYSVLFFFGLSALSCSNEGQSEELKSAGQLIKELKSKVVGVRQSAAQKLCHKVIDEKEFSPEVISALQRGLDDTDAEVRTWAASALVKTKTKPKQKSKLIKVLIQLVGDRNEWIRTQAVSALGGVGTSAKQVIPQLIKSLKDESPYVRRSAAIALGKFGREAKTAVMALIESLDEEGTDVRIFCAEALGNIGPDAKAAVPALTKAVENPYFSRFRSHAARALGRIGSHAAGAIPALLRVLRDKDRDTRLYAVEALGKIGRNVKQVVPALIQTLERDEYIVQSRAIDSLTIFGRRSPKAVESLVKVLDKIELRQEAAEALGIIGPNAKSAIPALEQAAKSEDKEFRKQAKIALRKIRGNSKQR